MRCRARANGGWAANDYKKYAVEHYPNGNVKTLDLGDDRIITCLHYQNILQTLRSAGMLRRSQGIYKVSGEFSTYLSSVQQAWIAFLTS